MIPKMIYFYKRLLNSYYAGIYILYLSFLMISSCSVKHKIYPPLLEDRVSSHSHFPGIDNNLPDSPELRFSKRLLWESRYNRWTALFNCASKAASSLFQGRMQPLFQIPVDFAWGWYQTLQCTPRERKSLFLLNTHLGKNPQVKNREQIERLVARLQNKKVKQLFTQEYRLGLLFMKNGNYARALFHLQNARDLDPRAGKVKNKIICVESELARQKRHRQASLAVLKGEDFFLSEDERHDYDHFIYSIVTSDSPSLQIHASSFFSSYPDSNYNDDVEYMGILRDFPLLQGDQIIARLQRLSRVYPDTNSPGLASDLLRDAGFHPLLDLRKQEDRYRADLKIYLFLGKRPFDERVYLVSGRAAQYPGAVLLDIGIFFFLDIGYRTMDCLFGDPIPTDELIQALCIYERKYPDSPPITSLRERISKLYSRQRHYSRALEFAQKAGSIPPGRLEKLSDKKAKAIYNMILEDLDRERKIRNLGGLLSLYPEASIAKRAKKSLDQLIEEDLYEFRLPKKDLKSCSALWDKAILNLDPDLFDGKKENGEMSRDGISAIKEGPIFYRMEGETIIREIPLTPEIRELVRSEIGFLGLGEEKKGSNGKSKERPFPLEISGGLGTGGWEVYPSFVPIPYADDDMDLFR